MEGYLAQIIMFAGNFAPRSWAFCQGQILSIAQNTALFSLLGTTYGGNGQTTFALPDFRGRTPIGTGQGPGLPSVNLGEMAGAATVTVLVSNLPAHTHPATTTVGVSAQNANSEEPGGNVPAATANNSYAPANTVSGSLGGVSTTVGVAGGGQPLNNLPPYIGMNFVICLEGIYPSRN